jgi:hypothetical protein
MLTGGESGPAVVPGDPDASLLMRAVRHTAGVPKMPRQAGKLTDAQIAAMAPHGPQRHLAACRLHQWRRSRTS